MYLLLLFGRRPLPLPLSSFLLLPHPIVGAVSTHAPSFTSSLPPSPTFLHGLREKGWDSPGKRGREHIMGIVSHSESWSMSYREVGEEEDGRRASVEEEEEEEEEEESGRAFLKLQLAPSLSPPSLSPVQLWPPLSSFLASSSTSGFLE